MPERRRSKVVSLPTPTKVEVVRIDRATWLVRQNGEPLRSPSGGVRKFGTQRRAMLAAQRAAGIVEVDERNKSADKVVAKLRTADPDTLAKVAELLG